MDAQSGNGLSMRILHVHHPSLLIQLTKEEQHSQSNKILVLGTPLRLVRGCANVAGTLRQSW